MGFTKYFGQRKIISYVLAFSVLYGSSSFIPAMNFKASANSIEDQAKEKIMKLPEMKEFFTENPGAQLGGGSWDRPYARVWAQSRLPKDNQGNIIGDRAYSPYFLVNYQTGAIYFMGDPSSQDARIKDRVFVSTDDDKYFTDGILADNHVFVPLRGIFDNYGAQLGWNGTNQTVSIVYQGKTIELQIGSTTAKVNGDTVEIDQAPRIVDGRTMIPVRFVSEKLGWKVSWVPDQNQVELNSPGFETPNTDSDTATNN